MSRRWSGSTGGGGDMPIHTSVGALTALGPALTVAWIWKPIALVPSGVYHPIGGTGTPANINPYSDGKIYWSSGGSFKGISGYTATDGWRVDAFTHESVSGGAGALRFHSMLYSNNVWSHTGQGTIGDSPAPTSGAEILLGAYSNSEISNAEYAVIGVFNGALSDLAIESLDTSLLNWMALSPLALWPFNQAAITDPVIDVTGGGADQTFRQGTLVGASDPPGFDYSLTVTNTKFARLGGAWVPYTRHVRQGGIWVPTT